MTFRDETRTPSWSVMVILSLALAGCGGESGNTATTAGENSRENTLVQARQAAPTPQEPKPAGKQYHQPSESARQDTQPEVEIDNPILAEPLPVPIPDGEGPKPVKENPAPDNTDNGQTDEPDPEVAEPEPEKPEPVADRPALHWDSPLTREDGSKLYPGEISGYRIYYRLRHQKKFKSRLVQGPDADSLTLNGFKPGAYEFAVSAVDTNGLESRRSKPVAVDLI